MATETLNHLETEDIKFLLSSIKDTLYVYEYPTSAVFSAITRCVIISYLYGLGYHDNQVINDRSMNIFRQLTSFSQKGKKYEWFKGWSQKLVEVVRHRRLTEDKTV
ncbi:hypothetical protein CMI37_04080 [Candidatus Pacearchaeota archaeon]|nr:hypothetical protein [Candidatus Pacearchaeota archaeon]